jgi:hypothetical protein
VTAWWRGMGAKEDAIDGGNGGWGGGGRRRYNRHVNLGSIPCEITSMPYPLGVTTFILVL